MVKRLYRPTFALNNRVAGPELILIQTTVSQWFKFIKADSKYNYFNNFSRSIKINSVSNKQYIRVGEKIRKYTMLEI